MRLFTNPTLSPPAIIIFFGSAAYNGLTRGGGVDCGEITGDNSEMFLNEFKKWSDTIGGATCGGYNTFAVVVIFIYSINKHWCIVFWRGTKNDVFNSMF